MRGTQERIVALTPEDADPQACSWIRRTPGVCGGSACVRNTRVSVWGLVEWRKLGLNDGQILKRVAGLTAEDLRVAWSYYEQHREEIDRAIRENAAA
jgi:uncharacterized protein (DUF433 family)